MYYLSGFLNEVREKLDRDQRSGSTVTGFIQSQEFENFCGNYLIECHMHIKPTDVDPMHNCYFCSLPLLIAAAKYASTSTRTFVIANGDVVSYEEDEDMEEESENEDEEIKCKQCENPNMKACDGCCETCAADVIFEACGVCLREWKYDHDNCNSTPIWLCDSCVVRDGGLRQ